MGRSGLLAGLLAALIGCTAVACTDSGLRGKTEPTEEKKDNLLEVNGEYCTEEENQVSFPVKVLFIVDESTSLQFTDENKKRYDALRQAMSRLKNEPNVEFAYIGFSSRVRSSANGDNRFTTDKSRIESNFLADPSKVLRPATDYQGALATAVRYLERDIQTMKEKEPRKLARTRYVVNFISDGVPAPRCKQGCEDDEQSCTDGEDNDGDNKVDGNDPDCDDIDDNNKHPDNLYGICNIDRNIDDIDNVDDNEYVEFDGSCPAYNQPRQILSRVQEIVGLEQNYNLGDIRMNSVFLFAPEDVVQQRLAEAGKSFGIDREDAKRLLRNMAEEGGGSFRDVNTETADESFLEFEVTSVKADRAISGIFARNTHGVVVDGELQPDVDSDGLADPIEREEGFDPRSRDTDGDGYGDLFEFRLADEGFDAADDSVPTDDCSETRFSDVDRLRDCEELYLGTDPNRPDTDADGITDGLELAGGTEPTDADAHDDVDFDGIDNLAEVRGGSDPRTADPDWYRNSRIQYTVENLGKKDFDADGDEQRCYRWTARSVPLATTPIRGARGLNRVLVRVGEKRSQIGGISPDVKTACVEAIYNRGEVKKPEDGTINMTKRSFERTRSTIERKADRLVSCPLVTGNPSTQVGNIEKMVRNCMGTAVEVQNYRYDLEELIKLVRRHVEPDLDVKLPDRPHEIFSEVRPEKADKQCFRPWEIDRVRAFFEKAARRCRECANAADTGTDAAASTDTK